MKIRFLGRLLVVISLLVLSSFVLPQSLSVTRSQPADLARSGQSSTSPTSVDLQKIPIGDGRISTQAERGFVWSCRTNLGGDGIGGAQASGSWIHPDGTYDLTAKPIVDGRVSWASELTIGLNGGVRTIHGNRLPSSPTGNFPIAPDDDAYAYDRNPNSIEAAVYQIDLPAIPQVAEVSSCLPLGEIGVLVDGGYFFNALDAGGRDAVAHEIQDACQGHPEVSGTYHYHSVTPCLEDKGENVHSGLIGYAWDGFGIYGHRGEDGKTLTNGDLDACHGHTHSIEWNGEQIDLYHYHATWEYPYTLGCFRGTPTTPTWE